MAEARRLVLVMGPGRSGTSTLAGALALSGYAVPDAIEGDETNPSGFHEPQFVVDLHTRLLERVGVRTLDTDPTAHERLAEVTGDDAVRAEARDWLSTALAEHDRLVVKDPRLVWFRDLWVDVARDLDADPASVVMLRHPAEVASSRQAYYDVREVTAVAGWINVALLAERLTAGTPRAIVSYPALTADWRPVLAELRDRLDLRLEPTPETVPHPVDAFVDPALRRMTPDWTGTVAPAHLRDLADRVHTALVALATGSSDDDDGADDAATDRGPLLALADEYTRLHADALAVTVPHVTRIRDEVRRRTARRVRTEMATRQAEAEAEAAAGQPGLGRRVARRLRGDGA